MRNKEKRWKINVARTNIRYSIQYMYIKYIPSSFVPWIKVSNFPWFVKMYYNDKSRFHELEGVAKENKRMRRSEYGLARGGAWRSIERIILRIQRYLFFLLSSPLFQKKILCLFLLDFKFNLSHSFTSLFFFFLHST